jgi:hypothetical protein
MGALHGSMPQTSISSIGPSHGFPPFAAGLEIVRFRERCPLSQVLLQSDQEDHLPRAQSTFSPKPHAWMMSLKPGASF